MTTNGTFWWRREGRCWVVVWVGLWGVFGENGREVIVVIVGEGFEVSAVAKAVA